uniref:J domain-containing protein n=1 Tax=Peronospora matthiolae TaxID=2874970 RepID=A0AAV1USH1_9STRA
MTSVDYYRVLNVASTASTKTIKAAYLQLAKALHPDVTGNDETKAERFKHVSEAHSVLTDAQKRREYDASRPVQSFRPFTTSGQTEHPYAATGGAPDLRARPLYGINEEVWLAHHYGPEAARRGNMPPRYYGMEVVEEKLEQQRNERIRRRQRHFKLNRTAGYFLRREARLQKYEEEQAKAQAKKEEEDKSKADDTCVIS